MEIKEKKQCIKNNKGITIISLAVTLVVLFILVGITMKEFDGKGMIERSKQKIEKQEIKELYDQIEAECLSLKVEKKAETIDKLIENLSNKLIAQGIISNSGNVKVIERNKKYAVDTSKGYKFELVIIDENNNIDVSYNEGKILLPLKIVVKGGTSKSIDIEVLNVENNSTIKYEYKKKGQGTFTVSKTTMEKKNTYDNLIENETYILKVETTKNGKTYSAEKEVRVKPMN